MIKSKPLTIRALRALPAFLTMRYLRNNDYQDIDTVVSQYCKDGLLDRVGEDCYHNVIAGHYDVFNAIRSVVKMPIYGGISCLHTYGIITQIPQAMSIYVIDQPDAPKLDGIDYMHRDKQWLDDLLDKDAILQGKQFLPFVKKTGHTSKMPIPTLHPQFVHLDMLAHNEMCGLDPDDFDWDFMEGDDISFMFEPPKAESTFDLAPGRS